MIIETRTLKDGRKLVKILRRGKIIRIKGDRKTVLRKAKFIINDGDYFRLVKLI